MARCIGRTCPHRQGRRALWSSHARGRGGAEADRPRHQAPACALSSVPRAWRATDLARRQCVRPSMWARDDGFWWAVEPRRARALDPRPRAPILPPARGITCEINPAARRRRPEGGRHHHRGRSRRSLSRPFRPHGRRPARPEHGRVPRVFSRRRVAYHQDGRARRESEALIVAPLDSPRWPACSAASVDAVRRYKAGDAAPARTALCTDPLDTHPAGRRLPIARWSIALFTRSSPSVACSAKPTISSRSIRWAR